MNIDLKEVTEQDIHTPEGRYFQAEQEASANILETGS